MQPNRIRRRPSEFGRHRRREIACPEDCPFLPAPRNGIADLQEELVAFAMTPGPHAEAAVAEWFAGSAREVLDWEQAGFTGWLVYGHGAAIADRAVERWLARHRDRLDERELATARSLVAARLGLFDVECESLLSLDPDRRLRDRPLARLTVHVSAGVETAGGREVHLAFFFEGADRGLPYLLSRDLHVRPEEDLEAILDSRMPDLPAKGRDPLFLAPELNKLVHLVINALLYATSVQPKRVYEPSSPGKRGPGPVAPAPPGEVFHLPGPIPISRFAPLRELERTESGRTIMKRFMVRGHWRSPNANWKEQHLRWIEPYWRGPDMGVIIEREYRMKP